MVEAVDPGRCESIGEQRRRQLAHDVRADQTQQDPALAHATPASAAPQMAFGANHVRWLQGRKPQRDTVVPLNSAGWRIYTGFC